VGTLEAAVICRCGDQPPRQCVDFSAVQQGAGPNPRTEQGVTVTVFDGTGAPVPATDVGPEDGFVGLQVGYRTEIALPGPCSAADAPLGPYLDQAPIVPPQLEAFNSDGTSAGTLTMSTVSRVAQTLPLAGPAITRLVITAPHDETRLLTVCFTPR